MKYFSIDLEITGLDVDKSQVLEIAVVFEDTKLDPLPEVEDLPFFHAIIKREYFSYAEPGAMIINQDLLRKVCSDEGTDELDAWNYMVNFVCDHKGDQKKAIAAGKNFAGFDYQFIRKHIHFDLFHHRVIDPGSVFIDWTKDLPPSSRDLYPPTKEHSSVEDARDVIRTLRRSYPDGKKVNI